MMNSIAPVPSTEDTNMTFTMPPEMTEATRLTSAGKLAEATALIRRLLGGRASSTAQGPTDVSGATTIDADYETIAPAARQGENVEEASRAGLGETLRRLAAKAKAGAASFDIGESIRPRPVRAPLPAGATFTTATYSNPAGMRDYKLYIPSTNRGQTLPLVVMLHGCSQSPDDFAAGTGMNALAEELGCLIAYPAQPASANANKCWNWFKPEDQQRGLGEPSLIAGITRQIMRDHPVDPARIYIAGLSAGGAAAAVMGAAYPELYAAVGVHSGLPFGAANDLRSAFAAMRQGGEGRVRRAASIPTIVFHGDQDSTVNPRNGDAIAAAVTQSAAGLHSTVQRGQVPGGRAYSRAVHADVSGRALCEHWTIHGAGHAWSGGSPAGSYTDPQGPDAAREMLRFFLAHRRDA
jgi:poly(hydroxyalkanoate) depolymerase family esterase